MSQKTTHYILIVVIIVSTLISGYILLDPKTPGQNTNTGGLAPIVDGKQEIKMTVLAVDYSPRSFKVKAGVPVRWEITSSGEPGCASGAVFSKILPSGSVYLNPDQGQVTVAEFTPQNAGVYKFSCSMNMARGEIEVVN